MTVHLIPISGIGEVAPGDDLALLILDAVAASGEGLRDGDVVVVTHKVVSKAEGRVVPLDSENPDAAYRALAEAEAVEVLRRRGDLMIAVTRHGFVCANAGVDRSNTEPGTAVTLPLDPDASAQALRTKLSRHIDGEVAVVVTDTFGRAWRRGLSDVAIGVAGIPAVVDLRGTEDMQGRVLEVTEVAAADEIAAAADLVMGKASGIAAAVVRGLDLPGEPGRGADLVRPPPEDLFR